MESAPGIWFAFALFSAFCLLPSAYCLAAAPTQEEVFKSISQNVSEGDGGGRTLLAVVLGGVGVVMLLTLLSSRRTRKSTPKALNHPGKLLKEIARTVPIRAAELKQLKLLVEAERDAGEPIDSPLVFLLCPSALTTAMRASRVKVDRKVMAGLARKLGLVAKK
jgi:hypothetical protein